MEESFRKRLRAKYLESLFFSRTDQKKPARDEWKG